MDISNGKIWGQSMCKQANRRQLLGALGGSALGVSLAASRAESATVTALAITCIDYRLVDDAVKFFDSRKLTNDYDLVSLAGASLAAVSAKFPSSNAAFWDHIAIARQLHAIKKVILVDHRDCGAYKVAFGKDFHGEGAAERTQHKGVMMEVQAKLKKLHPGLAAEFYLMGMDGRTERVI
jgi:carbonic anhydrase